MNYYIQGSAARAEEIKAAFEGLGYDTSGHLFNAESVLYFTLNGEIRATTCNCTPVIIKSHPDYKELELPVEPKFKDGDVLVTTKIRSCPFIYRKTDYNNELAYYYAGVDGNGNFCEGCLKGTLYHFGPVANIVPATKEQRDLLFAKMKEAGYEWDEKKKELRKVQPHYDISNFQPFDKVLVRVGNKSEWTCDFFSYYHKGFHCIGCDDWSQCIPFEGNENLLGTTDMPDECYVNW